MGARRVALALEAGVVDPQCDRAEAVGLAQGNDHRRAAGDAQRTGAGVDDVTRDAGVAVELEAVWQAVLEVVAGLLGTGRGRDERAKGQDADAHETLPPLDSPPRAGALRRRQTTHSASNSDSSSCPASVTRTTSSIRQPPTAR